MLKRLIPLVGIALIASVADAQIGPSNGANPNTVKTASLPPIDLPLLNSATETITVVDISGIATGGDDPLDDVVLTVPLAPGAHVIGIGFDVVLDSFDPSWLSEASIDFNGEVVLPPGVGDDFSGLGVPYSSGGIIDLVGLGFDFFPAGGDLVMTFFEGFDDGAVAPDGMWADTSLITVEWVPEPATFSLLLLAGLGFVAMRRR
jgi:hypothetical protein